jgi:hypothetical protein
MVTVCKQCSVGSIFLILLNWLRHSLSAKLEMWPRRGVKHLGTLIIVLIASLPIDSCTWLICVLTARANDWNTESKLPVDFLMKDLRYAWPDSTQEVLRFCRWGYWQAHATTNFSFTGTIDVSRYSRTALNKVPTLFCGRVVKHCTPPTGGRDLCPMSKYSPRALTF